MLSLFTYRCIHVSRCISSQPLKVCMRSHERHLLHTVVFSSPCHGICFLPCPSFMQRQQTETSVMLYIHTYMQYIEMGKLVYAVSKQQHVWTRRVWCCENARGVGRRRQSSIDRLPTHKTTFFTSCVYRILEREVVPLIHRNYSPLQKQGEKKPQKQAFLLVVFVQHTKLPASAAVCLHKNIYSVLQFIIAEAKSRLQVRSINTQHQKRI